MVFKNFTVQAILHLVVITALAGGSTFFLLAGQYAVTVAGVLLLVTDAVLLIRSFNRTNKSLAYFFDSVENDDSQLRFSPRYGNKSIQKLYQSMNRVNQLITLTKLQNQQKEAYYRALIQQSATGLIAMGPDHSIEIANDKACELTGVKVPVNLKRLTILNPALWEKLCAIRPGENETFKLEPTGQHIHILIGASVLRINGHEIKLISLQNIQHELEVRETESWQKLISILTHEMMNSIAPILSLTSTLSRIFKQEGTAVPQSAITPGIIDQTIEGLDVISERGKGLMNFVTSYRQLTKVPAPVFRNFSPDEWLHQIKILVFEPLHENRITLITDVHPHSGMLYGDEKLLTQVLLNLIYNAVDALREREDERRITVTIRRNERQQAEILVSNNGVAIPDEILDEIFIPFFTTKEEGSGIGLSLSRQIVQLHQGFMYAESAETETRFIIILGQSL